MAHLFKSKATRHALFFASLMLASAYLLRGTEHTGMIVLLFVAAFIATTPPSKAKCTQTPERNSKH